MNRQISIRVFLVGCPRSGTTLLQSLLAANSYLVSFPETHFYERLFSGRYLLSRLGISSRKARSSWKQFLEDIGHPELVSVLPKYSFLDRHYSKAFIHVLDSITLQQDKCVWLEKTPGHLRRIDQLERLIPSVRFIHILRNGEDNIASMFEVGNKYPEIWYPWYGTLDQCIERWVTDIRISEKYSGKKNHKLVYYSQLLERPKIVIQELCDFIDVPFEEQMLFDHSSISEKLVLKIEPWKSDVHSPIWKEGKRRFYDYLNEEQRQYIRRQVPEDVLEYYFYKNNGKVS